MNEEVEKVSAKVLEENDETIRGYLSKIKTVEAEVVEQKSKNQELKVKGDRCTTLEGEVTSLNLEIEQLKAVIKKAEEEKNPRSRLSARAAKK
jgi:predicted RNase H-like nuclease (RuvC/YqgF family)